MTADACVYNEILTHLYQNINNHFNEYRYIIRFIYVFMHSHAQQSKPPATQKSNISPEASQHWKIFGVVVVNFQHKPRTLPDLWTTFSHSNQPLFSAGFAGFAGFLIKTYRNIRKSDFSLREFCGNLRELREPYKNDI